MLGQRRFDVLYSDTIPANMWDFDTMLGQCLADVVDDGAAFKQRWVKVSCLLRLVI